MKSQDYIKQLEELPDGEYLMVNNKEVVMVALTLNMFEVGVTNLASQVFVDIIKKNNGVVIPYFPTVALLFPNIPSRNRAEKQLTENEFKFTEADEVAFIKKKYLGL